MVQVLLADKVMNQFSITEFIKYFWESLIIAKNDNFVHNNLTIEQKTLLSSLKRRQIGLSEAIKLCQLLDHSCGTKSEIRIVN